MFAFCEAILDGRDPRNKGLEPAKKQRNLVYIPLTAGTPQLQQQCLNYWMHDQLKNNQSSTDIDVILCACFDFLHSICQMDQDGLLYGQTIAKVFGFKHVDNYDKIIPLYIKERQNYLKFYNSQPKDMKEFEVEKRNEKSKKKG